MSRKEYQLQFKLQGASDSSFSTTFKTGTSLMQGMQSTIVSLNRDMKKLEKAGGLASNIQNSKVQLEQLSREHQKLSQAIKSTDAPSKEMKTALKQNEERTEALTKKTQKYKTELSGIKTELNGAGISTDNLTASQHDLAASYETAKKQQEDYARAQKNYSDNQKALKEARGDLFKTVGVATAVGAALYHGPVKQSMQFESNMADVVKVVDGLKDETTGKLTSEYHALKEEILDLSGVIPLVPKELAAITAEAGQAGIAREELALFTGDAAKMAIAFDSTAQESGKQMATWRTAFKYSQADVRVLADQINYLGDTGPATAKEIAKVVTTLGPLGEVSGFSTGDLAALGGTLIGVGVDGAEAATGLKRVMTTMSKGTSITEKQGAVLQKLNLDAVELAETMQVDATGGLLTFLKAVKALPEAEQTAALTDYFGQGSISAIAPLLTNLDLLEENYYKVGDASLYAGSMEKEFANRSDTTENKLELAKNSLIRTAVVLGDQFLPAMAKGIEGFANLTGNMTSFIAENPEAIKTISNLALSLGGTNIALKTGNVLYRQGATTLSKMSNLYKGFRTDIAGVGTTYTGAQKSQAAFKTGVQMLGGPIGVLTIGIGGLIFGVKALKQHQEQARITTLNFGKELIDSSKAYKEVAEDNSATNSLISEYQTLQGVVADVSSGTDEVADAKSRLKEIERTLIDQYPEYRNTLVDEKGLRADTLALIKEENTEKLQAAKKTNQQKSDQFFQNAGPALLEMEEIRGEISGESSTRDSLLEEQKMVQQLLERYNALSEEEKKAQEAGILSEYNDYKKSTSGDYDERLARTSIGQLSKIDQVSSGGVDASFQREAKLQDLLEQGEQSFKEGYQAASDVIAADLGGPIHEKLEELKALKESISALAEQENLSEEDIAILAGYRKEVEALEPKLLVAGEQQDALNQKMHAMTDEAIVPTIDLKPLELEINNFIATSRSPITIPVEMDFREARLTPYSYKGATPKLPGYAKGDIINKPTLAWFAEDHPEAAIPLDGGSKRSLDLWAYTGRQLGVTAHTAPDALPFNSGGASGHTFHFDFSNNDFGGNPENITDMITQRATASVLLALKEAEQDKKRLSLQ